MAMTTRPITESMARPVLGIAQDLTDETKEQARANLDAAAAEDVIADTDALGEGSQNRYFTDERAAASASALLLTRGVAPAPDRRLSFLGDLIRMGDDVDLVVVSDSKATDNAGHEGYLWRLKNEIIAKAPATTRINYHTFNFSSTPQRTDSVVAQAGDPRRPGFLTGGTGGRNGGRQFPSAAITNFTADADIRINVSFLNVTHSAVETLFCKGAASGNRGVHLRRAATSGDFQLVWYSDAASDGSAQTFTLPAATFGAITPGANNLLRVTMDIDNGSGNCVVTWWKGTGSSIFGTSWAQIHQSTGTVATVATNSSPWEIGARGNTGELLQGNIWEIDVRNGIADQNVTPFSRWMVPTNPAHWNPSPGNLMLDGGYDGTGGTINIFNMSYPGTKAQSWIIRPQMMPQIMRGAVLFATGDNEDTWGDALSTAMDNLLTQLRTFYSTEIPIGYIAANPNVAPFSNRRTQRGRLQHIMRWAIKNGLPIVDGFQPFARLGNEAAIQQYLKTDGQHPGDGTSGQSTKDGIGLLHAALSHAIGLAGVDA